MEDGIRQGNENDEIDVFTYVTEGTFDAYLYQLVENKQRFISQIMTSKAIVRSAEDIDEKALSYAEIKALAAGNPLIIEKTNLDAEVSKLKLLKQSYLSQIYMLEDSIVKYYPIEIKKNEDLIKNIQKDIEVVKTNTITNEEDKFSPMILKGKQYNEKEEAGKCRSITRKNREYERKKQIMEIKINKEIRDYKETIFFGLSMRQFIFSLIACGVAVLLYFLLKPYFGLETLSWICILGAIPFGVLGFVKYNGMNAEEFIWAWMKSEILTPRVLFLKPENIYEELLESEYKRLKKEELKSGINKRTFKSVKIKSRKGKEQNTKKCTTGNTNQEDIRRWNISSWDE